MKIISKGCTAIASQNTCFKKTLFKSLILALKYLKINRSKGAKLLLIWIINWFNRLFYLLGHSLTDN